MRMIRCPRAWGCARRRPFEGSADVWDNHLTWNVSLKYHFGMKTELVTNLKRQATRILSDLRDSGESILITEHGKPSAYLVDVESYEFMQNKLQVLESIVRGERAVLENRTYSEEEAKKKMSKWLG